MYFRVVNAKLAVVGVENYLFATTQIAQTTLRSVLGEVTLDELLAGGGRGAGGGGPGRVPAAGPIGQ